MMKMRYGLALMVLAAVGFLALPALAMPSERGYADAPHYGMGLMLDNVTKEELNNMTPLEIRELKQKQMETLNNMTLVQIKELRKQKNDIKCQANETRCQARMNQGQKRYDRDPMGGRFSGHEMDGQGMMPRMIPPMMGFGPFMLPDDLTEEELNNMTLLEIRKLRQKKMQELNNMTLAQIKELKQKKIQEQMDKLNNTTLGELKEQGRGLHRMAGFGMGWDGRDGMPGRRGMDDAGMRWLDPGRIMPG